MQSGGGVQGGHGRNMVAGPPSSASPSSSSSAVSTPQLGFDPMQQQQQQQRQTLQQQLLRNPEAREAMLAYQSGNLQRVLGTNVAQMQGQNPVHQAYNQYAFQNQQKSGLGMQPQQQIRMGTVVPSLKDPKMQDSDRFKICEDRFLRDNPYMTSFRDKNGDMDSLVVEISFDAKKRNKTARLAVPWLPELSPENPAG